MPDSPRNALVTGANKGIGKATALGLARGGFRVFLVCRDRKRGQRAVRELGRKTTGPGIELLIADLSSQRSIRSLAESLEKRISQLHVLVNNAAIVPPRREVSPEGIELQFAVNHLAYFLLTDLLLELLKAGAPARIINVASALAGSGRIDFDDLQQQKSYSPYQAYCQTKLCNLLFTLELARRLQGTGVTANSLHPGATATDLLNDLKGRPKLLRFLSRIKNATPKEGARTSIYLATVPEVEGVSGKYFANSKEADPPRKACDAVLARKLWEVSAKLTSQGEFRAKPQSRKAQAD